ncbi:unnamed protein product [Paramecium sonneborni]|uniref:PX domain-containing protein n=1 Tax=Paramecium sonneborni TaxID=65129 RepID=A0A8S1KYE8_9CILI|nr:unnamed protein product [Paramecium sonneborni]
MQDYIIEQNKIDVIVQDPTIKQNQEEFIIYKIQGQDRTGNFQIQRRFSEFYQLRLQLVEKWQYCYIPAIPEKAIQGNMTQQFVYQRLQMLNYFMRQLSHFQYLWYSQEVQNFIRQPNIQESNSNQQQKNYADYLISIFPQFAENPISQQNETIIEQFFLFIQNATPILQNYKLIMKNQINKSKNYFQQINIFQNYFIPEYETSLNENFEELQFRSSSKLIFDVQKDFDLSDNEKQFYIMYTQIKIELNEFQVLNGVIQEKKQLYLEIQSLKKQLKKQVNYVSEIQNKGLNIIKKILITKDEEIELQLSKLKQFEKELTIKISIYNLITNKLAIEIEFLKKIFSESYYCLVREMSQYFKKNAQDNISFYQNLLQQIENQGL